MTWTVRPSPLAGEISVPGDKSLAHRALMVGGLARGTSEIGNLPLGQDVLSTAACMRALGVEVHVAGDHALIESTGQLIAPAGDLDAGNSGTTMRLLSGVLAGQPFAARITGDASLLRRPMARVAEPLRRMGAELQLLDGRGPIQIDGRDLHAIRYELPVASAQIKSAVLLAGLFASGTTEVVEPQATRDHTERMLSAVGVPVHREGAVISLDGGVKPEPLGVELAGDVSTAAFFWAGAALGGGSVTVRAVGVNPTRTGFLQALEQMGVTVRYERIHDRLGEPVADVVVRGVAGAAIEITAAGVPALIDELPLLVLLATQVPGVTTIRGASELRVKETDRISTVTGALNAMGARIEEQPDGFIVRGGTPLHGAHVHSAGDHRLAMMLAVAGSVAQGTTVIHGSDAALVSFPGFQSAFALLGGDISGD